MQHLLPVDSVIILTCFNSLLIRHALEAPIFLFTTFGPSSGELPGFWVSMVFGHATISRKQLGYNIFLTQDGTTSLQPTRAYSRPISIVLKPYFNVVLTKIGSEDGNIFLNSFWQYYYFWLIIIGVLVK